MLDAESIEYTKLATKEYSIDGTVYEVRKLLGEGESELRVFEYDDRDVPHLIAYTSFAENYDRVLENHVEELIFLGASSEPLEADNAFDVYEEILEKV